MPQRRSPPCRRYAHTPAPAPEAGVSMVSPTGGSIRRRSFIGQAWSMARPGSWFRPARKVWRNGPGQPVGHDSKWTSTCRRIGERSNCCSLIHRLPSTNWPARDDPSFHESGDLYGSGGYNTRSSSRLACHAERQRTSEHLVQPRRQEQGAGLPIQVYLPGKCSDSRIQLWLLTDQTWGVATEPQVGTLGSTSSFQLVELTTEHKHYLVDARAGRIAS